MSSFPGSLQDFVSLFSPSSSTHFFNLTLCSCCSFLSQTHLFPPGFHMTPNIWSIWHTHVRKRGQSWALQGECVPDSCCLGSMGLGCSMARCLLSAMQAASPPPHTQTDPDARVGKRGHHEETCQLCHCSCSLCCWQLGLNIHGNKRLALCMLGTGDR